MASPVPVSKKLTRLVMLSALLPALAWAEPPSVTDDAGTLDQGKAKLEFEWGKSGSVRGLGLAFGYAPIDKLELEVSLARATDRSFSPSLGLRATGFAAKWVPLEMGATSAGLKLEWANERDDLGGKVRTSQILGLLSHKLEAGPTLHANLGRARYSLPLGLSSSATVWSLGVEVGMSERVSVVADWYGESGSSPGNQLGLRFKVREGLKLSVAAGRQGGQTNTRAVAAFEF